MNKMFQVKMLAAAITLIMAGSPVLADEKGDEIESSAKNSYVFQNYLKDDSIKVDVEKGVATLTGTVLEESHKSLAQDTVANLPGVTSVDNKLEITGEHPAEKSDAWLVTKVKTALLFHKNVSALTDVSAKDSVVTLSGKANSTAEKELTGEYAKDIEGVAAVVNNMTVAEAPAKDLELDEKIDDASTTASVKIVLLTHRSTSALHTGVMTKDGVVTLSGVAENAAEKSLATKLSSDVKGVDKVINNMSVEKTTKAQ